ncbi:MAG: D-alanyl-D-alanine carboxypeptidase, partial [Ktedonobacteraceae bacterium]|nr:D-alanyl-D-alanine carboxypeptidase [Ktedonobacteraceae bacterium]
MKRTIIVTVLIVLALGLLIVDPIHTLVARNNNPAPALHTSVAYLLDNDTNTPLLTMNGETRYPMASTTKIMTALIAIQRADLNQPVVVNQDAVDEVKNNMGSSAQLATGDTLTMHDMLYGLLLPSGDDAAIAIADSISGSPAHFVALMNDYARKLHLHNTHYNNPDGLTYYTSDGLPIPGHYTTAADLVQLTREALKNPLFAQIVKTKTYTVPVTADHGSYNWTNTNTLLGTYPGVLGVKTGSTVEAGACLVFAATQNGHVLIGAILQEPFNNQGKADRFTDARALLNWGFNQISIVSKTHQASS